MPEISIIIPVYNAEEWLDECLASVAAQSHGSWEAIVVDDGSTDASGSIASRYAEADHRFHILKCSNGGVSAARNRGLKLAQGRWITFLDADDRLHPHALTYLHEVAENSGAEVVVGRTVFSPSYTFGNLPEGGIDVVTGEEAAARFMYQRGMVNGIWATLYSTSLREHLSFRPGMRYEDLLMGALMLPHASKVALAPGVIYHYRDHRANFMNRWSVAHLDVLKVTEELCGEYANEPTLAAAARSRHFAAAFNIFLRATREHDADCAAHCWHTVRTLRRAELCDSKARIKNRLGALAAFGGRRLNSLLALWAGR